LNEMSVFEVRAGCIPLFDRNLMYVWCH
jgi:hypothetical protein